jgi:hypothetical protein
MEKNMEKEKYFILRKKSGKKEDGKMGWECLLMIMILLENLI